MPSVLSKEEISKQLEETANEFYSFCSAISHEAFFRQPLEKWSVAQNVKHLITSANTTKLAYSLPKFIVRLYCGKPNRPSRTYDELIIKYSSKLQQGGRASGRFIPQTVLAKEGQQHILDTFNKAMQTLGIAIQKKWDDPQLDLYIAPHPLLGKITLRELCYFTIYHTRHHLAIIKERLNDRI